MTIPSTPRKAGPYQGNGVQTAWPFSFKCFSAADVAVRLYDPSVGEVLLDSASYTVVLNSNQDTSPGGTITYPNVGEPIASGYRLVIVGGLEYDQPLDIPAGGNFSPVALENGLDRIVMQVQQMAEVNGRAVTVPPTFGDLDSTDLPAPEANALIGWNSTATALENKPAEEAGFNVAYGERTFDTFAGNGSQTAFSLTSPPANIADVDLSVDGVTLVPGTDYTLASNILTFTTAPSNGAEILARYGRVPQSLPFDVVSAVRGPFLLLDNTISYNFSVPTGKNALSISPTIADGTTVTVPTGSKFITLDEYTGGGSGEANTGTNVGSGLGLYAGKVGAALQFKSLIAGSNITLTPDGTSVTIAATGGGSGEANTASNLGTGVGLFASKSGVNLGFKSLVAGSNITLTPDANSVVVSASNSGEANTVSNIGTGTGLYASKVGVDFRLRSLAVSTGLSLASDGSTITLTNTAPGETNTASNLGASGEGVFASKSGVDLQFKKLKAGSNVTLTSDSSSITIAASGGSGTSLGLTNVKDYGAVGDGSTDDSTAFTNALAAVNTGIGGTLWIPPGKYRLNSALSATLATSTSVHIMGAGAEVSVLYFPSGSGITLTCVEGGYWTKNPSGNAITVSGLSLTTGTDVTGTALRVVGNTVTGRPVPPVNVNNVVIRGDTTGTGWAIGLHLDKAHAATVSHLNWFGKILALAGNAIQINADSTHNVSEFRFSNVGITYAAIGLYAESYVEGVHLTNVDMVAVNKGVEWLCSSTDESELAMANCHIAAALYCVHVKSVMDSHITSCLFFPSGAPTTWNGVRMDKSAATISGCFFGGVGAASNIGIVNTNLTTGDASWSVYHPTSIVNNCFRNMATAISLGANTGNVFVAASNQYGSDITTRVNNSSTTSLVEKRAYTGSVVISLTGGGASETVTVSVPANTFASAPESGMLMLAQNAEDLIGFYLYDSSTATSAQFLLKRRDGGTLPSGARRFSYNLTGL